MRLVVVGAYSLDVLQRKVVEMFSPVPSLPREPSPHALPVSPDALTSWSHVYQSPMSEAGDPLQRSHQKIFRIIPVKEQHAIAITWSLPSQMDHWASKPT